VSDRVIIEQTNNPVLVDGQSDAVLVQGEMRVLVTLSEGRQGVAGPTGPTGIQGPPGLSGANYVHDQAISSTTWTIQHNLNRFVSVMVVDSSDRVVEGAITYVDSNSIQISFNAAFTGQAYLN
jgi:hypothetical protein